MRQQGGFTLLELLVAMMVFSVLAVMAYQGLNSVLQARTVLEQRSQRLAQLQTAWLWLERDVGQLAARPVRSEYGDALAALTVPSGRPWLLEFTRGGWRNPLGSARSSLVRVAYGVQNGQLIRWHWTTLDRGIAGEPVATPMLANVQRIGVRYLDRAGQWQAYWPPAGREQEWRSLPRAVDIELDVDGWGRMQRVLLTPGEG